MNPTTVFVGMSGLAAVSWIGWFMWRYRRPESDGPSSATRKKIGLG